MLYWSRGEHREVRAQRDTERKSWRGICVFVKDTWEKWVWGQAGLSFSLSLSLCLLFCCPQIFRCVLQGLEPLFGSAHSPVSHPALCMSVWVQSARRCHGGNLSFWNVCILLFDLFYVGLQWCTYNVETASLNRHVFWRPDIEWCQFFIFLQYAVYS